MAEDLANETGQDLGTVRQTIKEHPGLTIQEYRDIIIYGLENDPEVQSTGQTEVSRIREENNLTSNRQMDKNMAVANYNINGNTGELPAISGPEKPGFVEALPNGSETRLTPTLNQSGYVANKDAEYKILERLAEEYWSDDPAVRDSLTGEIHLYTERPRVIHVHS